jgi:hypothetical protein
LREAVEQGAPIYREGTIGVNETNLGQFWAGQNPLTTANYAQQYGTALGQGELRFVMQGTIRRGASFITREAPAFGSNVGEPQKR